MGGREGGREGGEEQEWKSLMILITDLQSSSGENAR